MRFLRMRFFPYASSRIMQNIRICDRNRVNDILLKKTHISRIFSAAYATAQISYYADISRMRGNASLDQKGRNQTF